MGSSGLESLKIYLEFQNECSFFLQYFSNVLLESSCPQTMPENSKLENGEESRLG